MAKIHKLKEQNTVETSGGKQTRYDVLFDNALDPIFVVTSKNHTFENVNHRFCDLSGFSKEELENENIEKLFAEKLVLKSRSTKLTHEVLNQDGLHDDVVFKAKDGTPRFVALSVRKVMMDESEPLSICIMRDMGEKKTMERELITKHTELRSAFVELEKVNAELKVMQDTLVQTGKLAALGELASGIAHELNQPLAAIKGFAQEALELVKKLPKSEVTTQATDYVSEIATASVKMEKIISNLRGFTRKSTEDFKIINVHDVIDEALKMLQAQFKNRGITVVKKYNKEVPEIYCNPFQLEQVLINFFTNARDAIEIKKEKNGTITIFTDFNTNVKSMKSDSRDMIQIKVQDNGVGIPENIKHKIFNPFYTTKEVGKGMGLGLSISYGILSKMNGSVFVESEVGKGAAFTVSLPVDFRKH